MFTDLKNQKTQESNWSRKGLEESKKFELKKTFEISARSDVGDVLQTVAPSTGQLSPARLLDSAASLHHVHLRPLPPLHLDTVRASRAVRTGGEVCARLRPGGAHRQHP